MTKLPDPKVNGNAGSFFKNPVISSENAKILLEGWPTAPHYPQADGSVKLAAGWLIDQCQLKGTSVGGAAVHQHQALVLINQRDATAMMLYSWLIMFVSVWAKNSTSGWSQKFASLAAQVKSMPWRLSREGQYHPLNPDWHSCRR